MEPGRGAGLHPPWRRGCTGLFEVSPEPGRREHLMKQAKGSACHPVPWHKAVELLVAVCACSSEQAADARSLHKSGNSSTALRKKKIHPKSFKHKDISDSRGPDRGHCSVFSQCWEAAGASTQPGHRPVPGAGAQLPAGASWTCSAAALRRELFGFYFYRSLRGLCDVLTDPFVSGCRSSSQPAAPGDTRGICRGLTSASQLHAALPTPVVKAAII